jgi:hypothetical protein
MTCAYPPELSDQQLLLHADGLSDDDIELHLSRCDFCRARLEKLTGGIARIQSAAYRSQCPDSMVLTGFHINQVSESEAQQVATHLEFCAECQRELRTFKQFLQTSQVQEPETSSGEALQVIIARLMAGMAPAAALRGGEGQRNLIFEAGDRQISVLIEPDAELGERYHLTGMLLGEAPASFRAFLWRRGAMIAEAQLEALGSFSFGPLTAGAYDLVLDAVETEIHLQNIQIA